MCVFPASGQAFGSMHWYNNGKKVLFGLMTVARGDLGLSLYHIKSIDKIKNHNKLLHVKWGDLIYEGRVKTCL